MILNGELLAFGPPAEALTPQSLRDAFGPALPIFSLMAMTGRYTGRGDSVSMLKMDLLAIFYPNHSATFSSSGACSALVIVGGDQRGSGLLCRRRSGHGVFRRRPVTCHPARRRPILYRQRQLASHSNLFRRRLGRRYRCRLVVIAWLTRNQDTKGRQRHRHRLRHHVRARHRHHQHAVQLCRRSHAYTLRQHQRH